MFGRKCSLCGGKLDARHVCKECGLDNTKSDKNYRINESSCNHRPLTHVHEETKPKTKNTVKSSEQSNDSYHQNRVPKKLGNQKKGSKGIVGLLSGIIVGCAIIIPVLLGLFGNVTETSVEPEYYSDEYNPYEYLENELPQFGDTLMYTLRSGQYVVGVHIAEGYYKATVFEDYDSIEVTDHENGIYLYEYPANGEDNYLDDLRLFEGAVVTITSKDGIRLDTENGQTGEMPALVENFLTDRYVLRSYEEAAAGVSFEPGIYDICIEDGYGYVNLTIYDEDGAEREYKSFDLGEGGLHGNCFRNVVIPEGAIIMCEEADIELVPSEWIWTTDYMEYYY